jgi:hypothetical protein
MTTSLTYGNLLWTYNTYFPVPMDKWLINRLGHKCQMIPILWSTFVPQLPTYIHHQIMFFA